MKTILVPVDFSAAMAGVIALAREMAKAFNAELHVVHVREIAALPVFPAATIGYPGVGMPEMGMGGGIPITPAEMVASGPPNEQRNRQLENLTAELRQGGLHAVAEEREGSVVEEILRAAEEVAADLIVMGSHGHGSVYNLLVGSVTEGVLKESRRPVLLVPAPVVGK